MVAATLAGSLSPAVLWSVALVAILTWWWGSTEWPWTWLLGVMEACFGVQWAMLGAYGLAAFPHERLAVGVLWAAYAGGIAGVSHLNRKRAARYGW